jgi:precorrin-4 methylase
MFNQEEESLSTLAAIAHSMILFAPFSEIQKVAEAIQLE